MPSVSSRSSQGSSKLKAAKEAIDQIRERFGEGSIMRLGDARKMDVDTVSTGCLSLDLALGVLGVPRGRVIEIYGPEASGKTTLALHIVANVQKGGGVAAYVDAEHALDPEYARRIGVNIDDLLISQPDTGEQALEIVETLIRSNAIEVVVIDSVAALTPKAEIEGEMGQQHMALQARLMSQALRKLTALVSKSNVIIIFINQIRMKVGVFFGNPETTTGGTALKFYSSVRIEVRRAANIKIGEEVVGNRMKAKIVKNKIAPPFKTCEFDIMYNEGISFAGDILDLGVTKGVIAKSGNSFSFGERKLGIGHETARKAIREDPKLLQELREKIIAAVKSAVPTEA